MAEEISNLDHPKFSTIGHNTKASEEKLFTDTNAEHIWAPLKRRSNSPTLTGIRCSQTQPVLVHPQSHTSDNLCYLVVYEGDMLLKPSSHPSDRITLHPIVLTSASYYQLEPLFLPSMALPSELLLSCWEKELALCHLPLEFRLSYLLYMQEKNLLAQI